MKSVQPSAVANEEGKEAVIAAPKPIITKSSSFKSPRAKTYKLAEESTLASLTIAPEIPTSKSVTFLPNNNGSSSNLTTNLGLKEVTEKTEQSHSNHIEGLQDIAHKTTASAIASTLQSLLHQFQ